MLTDGFISLHRSLLKWEWYDNANTARLFIHLLLTCNYYDEDLHGINVKRGQRLTSRSKLALELHLSEQQIRTAISHLISTNEITISGNPQYTVITVLQYDKYQSSTNQLTNNQPTSNQRATNEQPLINNNNKANKPNNISIVDLNTFFDSIWLLYPKKEGKGSVSKTQKEVLYKIGYDEIKRCVDRYLSDKGGTEIKYMKMGSTFFNSGYIDYLDKNYIKAEELPKEIPPYQEVPDTTPLYELFKKLTEGT